MSKMYKLVAPEFFDKEVTVQEHYHNEICDALYEGRDSVFCHFEGDRHAYIPLDELRGVTLDFSITEERIKSIEITDETVFE